MKILGIIAEYNPFHPGHAWMLEEAKRQSGAGAVIVVMSGDFVQRGEPALTDKYRRSRMALKGGADLVLELPPAFATGSAEAFARGAVGLLDACGCVTDLAFGVEAEQPELLLKAAELLENDGPREPRIRELLRLGLSYPAAVETALTETEPELGALLKTPNNTLGVEYLKALKYLNSGMKPLMLRRRGQDYRDSNRPGEETGFASASALRRLYLSGGREALGSLAAEDTLAELDYGISPDALSLPLSVKLSTLEQQGTGLSDYEDVSPELAARILAQKPFCMSFTELAAAVATRAFTEARVRRALIHILLEIRKGDSRRPPEALKLLGLRKAGPAAALVKQQARLPLITKTADAAPELNKPFCLAADIYNACVRAKTGLILPDDYRQSPAVL